MAEILRYEYAIALREAGYPQPEFSEGQLWYQTGLANQIHITSQWMFNYTKGVRFRILVQKARLIYAPDYVELANAVKIEGPVVNTIEELADLWLAQNRKR
jgi:hypothetical protein